MDIKINVTERPWGHYIKFLEEEGVWVKRVEVKPGARLATDARTRARLELDDGTVIVLDRATEVEVGADEEAHLVAWLGKKLDHPLATPDLTPLGYHLVGGRLVPTAGRSGALFMYEDAGGTRLTLLVGQNGDNRETGFRYATDGPVETFYWIDGPLGYAISGEIPRARLQTVADEIYRQIETVAPAPQG